MNDSQATSNPPPADIGSNVPSDVPLSTLAIPITVTAGFLEQSLDRVLDGLNPEHGLLYHHEDLDIGHGLKGDVEVWRHGSTHVVMANDRVVVTLPVRVRIRATWQPHVGSLSLPLNIPVPVDIHADYTVRMFADPQLDAGFDLRLNATFDYEVNRPVGIEAIGFGVTLSGATRSAAEEALHNLGSWLNSAGFDYLNFREEADRGWHALQQPMSLSAEHHVRLEVAPESIHARQFRTEGNIGVLGLAVVARVRARASSGAPPPPVPLPWISSGEPPEGVSLALPLDISFDALQAALREKILHQPWHVDERQLLLRDVAVSGSDSGELQVRMDVTLSSGDNGFELEASLTASGCPRLDSPRQQITLEDFRYDMHTDRRLVNVLSRLFRPFAATVLGPWLSFPLEPQAQRLLAEVNGRLERGIPLTEGITLHGKAHGVHLSDLRLNASGLLVLLETHGELVVQVDHAPTAGATPGTTPGTTPGAASGRA